MPTPEAWLYQNSEALHAVADGLKEAGQRQDSQGGDIERLQV